MDLTEKHLHILQHSLGVDRYGRGRQYRNHFVPGGKDVELCKDLERALLMRYREVFGDACYHVTDLGKKYVADNSPEPPKLTAGQRRYRKWLAEDGCTGLRFGEWLKAGHGRDA